jgi:orotidine-5'-phosphate decarboxylase
VVAGWLNDWNGADSGYGTCGAVVGATRPEELHEWRRQLPRSVLLLPGVGAQGGRPKDLAPAFDSKGLGALAAASRAVEYASRGKDFAKAAAGSARELRDALNEVLDLS